MIQILNILSGYPLEEERPFTSKTINRTVQAMQRAFADRAIHLGDPDFVDIPVDRLLSLEYAKELRDAILPGKATPS